MTRYFDLSLTAPGRLDPPCSVFSPDPTGTMTPIVLELGSGTGYVGLKLAQVLDAQGQRCQRTPMVILTDLPEVCPLLEENLNNERIVWEENDMVRVDVLPLPWGDARAASALSQSLCAGSADNVNGRQCLTHIICSDLVSIAAISAMTFGVHLNDLLTLGILSASPCTLASVAAAADIATFGYE